MTGYVVVDGRVMECDHGSPWLNIASRRVIGRMRWSPWLRGMERVYLHKSIIGMVNHGDGRPHGIRAA